MHAGEVHQARVQAVFALERVEGGPVVVEGVGAGAVHLPRHHWFKCNWIACEANEAPTRERMQPGSNAGMEWSSYADAKHRRGEVEGRKEEEDHCVTQRKKRNEEKQEERKEAHDP